MGQIVVFDDEAAIPPANIHTKNVAPCPWFGRGDFLLPLAYMIGTSCPPPPPPLLLLVPHSSLLCVPDGVLVRVGQLCDIVAWEREEVGVSVALRCVGRCEIRGKNLLTCRLMSWMLRF